MMADITYYVDPHEHEEHKKRCYMEIVKQVLAWKLAKVNMVHNDILNFFIESGAVTADEVKSMMKDMKKTPITPVIPSNHMDD